MGRVSAWAGAVAAVAVVALVEGCGGGAGLRPGTYRGPNELRYALTSPAQQEMPVERHRGTAEVIAAQGDLLTLRLTMFEGGDHCDLSVRRLGGDEDRHEVVPGQECASRFAFDGTPVAAVVAIDEGSAAYVDGTLRIELSGRFVADRGTPVGTVRLQGIARWSFEGRR